MKFQFKLRKGKQNFTVLAELRHGTDMRIRRATPFFIPVRSLKYWDGQKEIIKHPNDVPDSRFINQRLNEIRTEVYSELMGLGKDGPLNKQELRDRLGQIIDPVEVVEGPGENAGRPNSVLDYFYWYPDFYSKNISPNTGKVFSRGTAKGYKNSARFFGEYLKSRSIKCFTFDDITKDFYYDYIQYAQDLGYSKNYIGSMLQKLKCIIQAAFDDDLHSNREFRKKYFKKFRENVNHPYLTEDEIRKLYNLKIRDEHLDNVRDIFIIACYTGLRVGDLMRFLKNPGTEYFNGRKFISVVQIKTNKPVYIPLKQIILDILKKRNGKFPQYIHQKFINEGIKPLLKKCGVTETVIIEKTIGGRLVAAPTPKYKLVSCHTARRSFCTNAYNSGMPLRDIMAFSGHSSEKMVLLYIKSTAKEKAKFASDHEFFD